MKAREKSKAFLVLAPKAMPARDVIGAPDVPKSDASSMIEQLSLSRHHGVPHKFQGTPTQVKLVKQHPQESSLPRGGKASCQRGAGLDDFCGSGRHAPCFVDKIFHGQFFFVTFSM